MKLNNLVIDDVEFSKVPDASWKERLQNAQEKLRKRTTEAFLEFAAEVHAFREDCDRTQGGSEFQSKGCEWLNCSPATLHAWDATGRRASELSGAPESLPRSEDSICRIASLDDLAFRKALPRLRSDMPQAEVRELVKELNTQTQPAPVSQDEQDKRKRERLYAAFMGLPDKQQFILGRAIYSHIQARGWKP